MGSSRVPRNYSSFFRASSTFKRLDLTNDRYEELSERLLEEGSTQSKVKNFKDLYTGRNKDVKRYYESQQQLIDKWQEVQDILKNPSYYREQQEEESKGDWLINISMIFNFCFLAMMVYLVARTLLLTIIAVALDSVLDNVSGIVLFSAHKLSRQEDKHNYPLGKYRFELVGIIMFASIMATLQLTVIVEAIQSLILKEHPAGGNALLYLVFCLLIIIVGKGILFVLCQLSKNDSVQAMAQDHRNDFINSLATLFFVYLSKNFNHLWDPIGAMIISTFLVVSWFGTAMEYASFLLGKGAPPEILQLLTIITFNHSQQIDKIDTIHAFQFGKRYFAEIHIVLPEDMPLKQCHNIGESLQYTLELLPDIDRAYVHLDYETDHNPHTEHYAKGQMHSYPSQQRIMEEDSQVSSTSQSMQSKSQSQQLNLSAVDSMLLNNDVNGKT